MAQRLADGNIALALLCDTLAPGAILPVIILMFGSVSGTHFNPAVSIAFALRGELPGAWPASKCPFRYPRPLPARGLRTIIELPVWQVSTTVRSGSGQWLAEGVAVFGLLLTIFDCPARAPGADPYAVGLYITSAYWFTASTSFANPTVTIARSLSDTFAGIAPAGISAFISTQFAGMFCAIALARWLWEADAPTRPRSKPRP
jgi:glycerol uptake facilitator-like aquaporin